jgi:hypothetical protein
MIVTLYLAVANIRFFFFECIKAQLVAILGVDKNMPKPKTLPIRGTSFSPPQYWWDKKAVKEIRQRCKFTTLKQFPKQKIIMQLEFSIFTINFKRQSLEIFSPNIFHLSILVRPPNFATVHFLTLL